jgi:hypothetical protein
MAGLGGVDLALSAMYSALLVGLLVASYRSLWPRRSNTRE